MAEFTDNTRFNTLNTAMQNIHAAELQAVGIGLVMWGQVIVVEDSDPKHSGVDAGAEEKDCNEARHLQAKNYNISLCFS